MCIRDSEIRRDYCGQDFDESKTEETSEVFHPGIQPLQDVYKRQELLEGYQGLYCVESFDPRIVRWVRKNHPKIVRGQLMCYKPEEDMPGWMLSLIHIFPLGSGWWPLAIPEESGLPAL